MTITQGFLTFVTKTQGLQDKTNAYPPSGPKSKPSGPQEICVPSLGTTPKNFYSAYNNQIFKTRPTPKNCKTVTLLRQKTACQNKIAPFFFTYFVFLRRRKLILPKPLQYMDFFQFFEFNLISNPYFLVLKVLF